MVVVTTDTETTGERLWSFYIQGFELWAAGWQEASQKEAGLWTVRTAKGPYHAARFGPETASGSCLTGPRHMKKPKLAISVLQRLEMHIRQSDTCTTR